MDAGADTPWDTESGLAMSIAGAAPARHARQRPGCADAVKDRHIHVIAGNTTVTPAVDHALAAGARQRIQ